MDTADYKPLYYICLIICARIIQFVAYLHTCLRSIPSPVPVNFAQTVSLYA
jgi:hypothetical protein